MSKDIGLDGNRHAGEVGSSEMRIPSQCWELSTTDRGASSERVSQLFRSSSSRSQDSAFPAFPAELSLLIMPASAPLPVWHKFR